MTEFPWFAWIPIVAIIMWGLITVANTIAQRPSAKNPADVDRDEFDRLKRRVEDLEHRANRRD